MKFCSLECQRSNMRWVSNNLPRVYTEETRMASAARIGKYISNETSEQRFNRTRGIAESRQNGTYVNGRLGKIGEKDPNWLGEDASYNSKHRWIQNHWQKTNVCENCGEEKHPNPNTRLKYATQWHNISKTYHRERSDWMEVCISCHRKLDKTLMNIQNFEKELLQLDSELSIRPTPTKGLAGVFYKGVYLLACPDGEIYDDKRESYFIEINGRQVVHRTRPEVIEIIKAQIGRLKIDKDYLNAFFGEGEYSDVALK